MSNVAAVPRTNEQIVARIKAGEEPAAGMLELYKQNKGMIYRVAKKYSGYAEIDDLMQEGYLALCDAVEHYNLEQDVLFMTYTGYWLNQRMQRYIDNCCRSVRFPVHLQIDIRKYEKIVKEYWKEYNREPSERELCRRLYVSREKLMDIKKNAKIARIRSLSEPIGGEDEDITLGDSVASDQNMEEDICRELDYDIMQKALWNTVDDLPEQQAAVIRMRYRERMTLDAVGKSMGVSRERVRKEDEAVMKPERSVHREKKKYPNLIPNSARSPEELREMGRKGGIKSGESRRKKREQEKRIKMMAQIIAELPEVKERFREMAEMFGGRSNSQ